MRIALTFVVLAFSQLKFSFVHATEENQDQNSNGGGTASVTSTGTGSSNSQQSTAGNGGSRTATVNNVSSENVNLQTYNEVFPTVEMRFRAVMGMLKAGKPNLELIELLVSKLGGISDESSSPGTNSGVTMQAAASVGAVVQAAGASGETTTQTQLSGSQDSADENPSEVMKKRLTSVCESLDKLFTELFGEYSSMTTKELGKEKVFLNLRFALPLFVKDLKDLGVLAGTGGAANAESLKKWVADKFPEVKANPSMSVDNVKEHLAAMKIGTNGKGDNSVEILSNAVLVYNTRNGDFEKAKKDCKELVSSAEFRSGASLRSGAAFGSVTALMTAVLAFTLF
ncbi:uncharacterized protein BcabD6B2_35860 [Babesia caballi]|uniref:Membrane protein, putative n=1 Tax=Babesia caballi TaxID=5871 RepID=A0AAV4LYC6_BABCB|nr:membrane protein, putative [Babesia caballi]